MIIQKMILSGGDYYYLDSIEINKVYFALLNYPKWNDLLRELDKKIPIKMGNYRSANKRRMPHLEKVLLELDLGFVFVMPDINSGVTYYSDFNPTIKVVNESKWNYFRIKYEI